MRTARTKSNERTCKTCRNTFYAVPSSPGQYCSKACMYARNDTTRNCECCGKAFRSPPSQMHVKTCSTECGYKIRKLPWANPQSCVCKQCGIEFLESPSHAGRRLYCSTVCRDADPDKKQAQSVKFSGANNPGWRDGACRQVLSCTGKTYARQTLDRENVKSAKRRAAKLQATVAWADQNKIAQIYAEAQRLTELTGVKYHVDHIVPLTSRKVSGLHCEFNLQLLPEFDNLSKANRRWPDMPS